jgi:peptidoglycan/LPS O-acetylase OafA/YrhL
MVFERWLPGPMQWILAIPSARLILFGTATLVVAAASWQLLEQPVNRFRSKKTRAALGPVPSEDESRLPRPMPLNKDDGVYEWRKRVFSS